MYYFDKVYSKYELFEIQRKDYNGYVILEHNYKKNNNRGILYDRYRVIKIVPDVAFIDSLFESTSVDGMIFIQMVEKNN